MASLALRTPEKQNTFLMCVSELIPVGLQNRIKSGCCRRIECLCRRPLSMEIAENRSHSGPCSGLILKILLLLSECLCCRRTCLVVCITDAVVYGDSGGFSFIPGPVLTLYLRSFSCHNRSPSSLPSLPSLPILSSPFAKDRRRTLENAGDRSLRSVDSDVVLRWFLMFRQCVPSTENAGIFLCSIGLLWPASLILLLCDSVPQHRQ